MWHIFFDTNELRGHRFPTVEIFEAAARVQARLYVPELVLEERALQLLTEEFQGVHAKAKRFERQLGVSIPPLKPRDELLESFRADLRALLTEQVTISAFDSIDAGTQQALFDLRLHAEFKDTAIVLSVIGQVAAMASPVCLFVTDDKGIRRAVALSDFARTRGVFLAPVEQSDLMLALQQQPEIVAAASTFVESRVDVLETYLNGEIKDRVLQNMVASPPSVLISPDKIEAFVETFGGESPDLEARPCLYASISSVQ
jgi:hypothetical protein